MPKKYSKKVHQEPLRAEWAQSLLAKRDPNGGGSLYEALQAKIKELDEHVRACQEHLKHNPLTGVVAEAAAREAGRGGYASIKVDEQGVILLEVRPKKSGEKRGWMTTLPSIKDLRAEAEKIGLDISDLGRSKRKIFEAIQAHKGRESQSAEKPKKAKKRRKKMTKTGDAISTPRVVDPSELPFDESSELPADLLDGDSEKPDMDAALAESTDVDLDAILDDSQD